MRRRWWCRRRWRSSAPGASRAACFRYRSRSTTAPPPAARRRASSTRFGLIWRSKPQVFLERRGGGVEAHRTVRQGVDELLQVRVVRSLYLFRRALAEHHAVTDDVDVVRHLQRLGDVVGHNHRGELERLVHLADERDDVVERDGIEPGE